MPASGVDIDLFFNLKDICLDFNLCADLQLTCGYPKIFGRVYLLVGLPKMF